VSSYVERNLVPGETVGYRARVAWAPVLYPGVTQLIAAFVLFLIGSIAKLQNMKLQDIWASISAGTARSTTPSPHPAANHLGAWTIGDVVEWIAFIVFIIAIVSLVRGWIFRATAEYAVTDQRVIGKYGLIGQQSVDIRMAAITGVKTSNTLLGRIFGYGTVWVNSAGGSDYLVLMKDPRAFETAVYASLKSGTAAYPPDAGMAPTFQPQTAPGVSANSRACPRCHLEPGAGARFCPQCGYALG
jgi:hypothetical protein